MFRFRKRRQKERFGFETIKGLPNTTLECLEFVWAQNENTEWYGGPDWELKAFTPRSAYTFAWLARRIDPQGPLLQRVGERVARKFAATQSPEGYFDYTGERVSADLTYDLQLEINYGGRKSERLDFELYDMVHTYDLVRLLKLADTPLKDRDGLIAWINAAQTPQGRFSTEDRYNQMYAERTSRKKADRMGLYHPTIGARAYEEIKETALAVLILAELGAEPRNRRTCIDWLQSYQSQEGYFHGPAYPDYYDYAIDREDPLSDDIRDYIDGFPEFDTPWAVFALDALGETPRDLQACIDWLVPKRRYPNADWTGKRWKDSLTGAKQWLWEWETIEALYCLGWKPSPEEWELWRTEMIEVRTGGLFPLTYPLSWRLGKSMKDPPFPLLGFSDLDVTYFNLYYLDMINALDESMLETMR
ncbi:MAG: hypothetical protein GTO14_10815 [Anaerolineales bacterium]|nr:hypothetical protein [Anaerolineales bacterium]